MTREKAIKELTQLLHEDFLSEYSEAIRTAIKALDQEPCGDCISREAVENAIKHAEINFTVNSDIDFTKHKREVQEIVNGIIDAQIKALRDLQSVSPHPEVGRWIYDKNIDNWKCSECGETPKTMGYCGAAAFMAEHFKYCNHCGCKMQEAKE